MKALKLIVEILRIAYRIFIKTWRGEK